MPTVRSTGPLDPSSGLPGYVATTTERPQTGEIFLPWRSGRYDIVQPLPPVENRIGVRPYGIVMSNTPPQNGTPCEANEYNAIVTRQLCQKVKPGSWEQVTSVLAPRLGQIFPGYHYEEVTFDYWNSERGVFTPSRVRNHITARESLNERLFNKSDKTRETFIKTELANQLEPYQVRCISGAKDRFNVFFGPPLYSFSKSLSRCWNKNHWCLYTSGSTSQDISDWTFTQHTRLGLEFKDSVKILADESRQDAHVHEFAMEWERFMFEYLGVPTTVINELKECVNTFGYTKRTNIRYTRTAGRNTGDPHTSSGNSLMNAVKAIYSLHKQLPQFDYSNPPFALAIQGDDSLIFLKPEFEKYITSDSFVSISADLGFCVKFVTITKNIVDVDYCSRYFWPTNDHPLGYLLGPKPFKVLNKVAYSKIEVPDIMAQNRGVALGLYNDVQHIPLLKEWCDRVLQVTSSVVAEENANLYSIRSDKACNMNSNTWNHLFERYGLTEVDVELFRQSLQQVNSLPFFIQPPLDFGAGLKRDS